MEKTIIKCDQSSTRKSRGLTYYHQQCRYKAKYVVEYKSPVNNKRTERHKVCGRHLRGIKKMCDNLKIGIHIEEIK